MLYDLVKYFPSASPPVSGHIQIINYSLHEISKNYYVFNLFSRLSACYEYQSIIYASHNRNDCWMIAFVKELTKEDLSMNEKN
jgi:hypothetical protein